MTAIQALQAELQNILSKQNEHIMPSGHCRSECRYEYAALVRQAKEYQQAIEFLENMRKGG